MYNLPVEDMHAPVLGEKAWVSLATLADVKGTASIALTADYVAPMHLLLVCNTCEVCINSLLHGHLPSGPSHPYQKDGLAAGHKNHYVGHVEVGWVAGVVRGLPERGIK